MDENHLGAFLRARRAGLTPRDVDMVSHGTRRVAGLRREEVAVLAGVNADYYTRLEQGRERNPSPRSWMPSPAPCGWTATRARTCSAWPAAHPGRNAPSTRRPG